MFFGYASTSTPQTTPNLHLGHKRWKERYTEDSVNLQFSCFPSFLVSLLKLSLLTCYLIMELVAYFYVDIPSIHEAPNIP